MVEYGCDGLWITQHYIANNNLHWEPGETTSFTAYIDNINENVTCDTTVGWQLHGEGFGDYVAARGAHEVSGETRFLKTLAHEEILDEVGSMGRYNMKTIVLQHGDKVAEEWWTDDNGDKHELVIYGSDGTKPGASANINVRDIYLHDDTAIPGQTVTADVEAENTGDLEGSKTYDVIVGGSGVVEQTIATMTFNLSAGGSTEKQISFETPDGDNGWLEVGGTQSQTLNIIQDPIDDRGLSVTTGVNEINAVHTLYNAANTSVKVNVDAYMEHVDSGSTIWQQTYEVTIPGEDTTDVKFSNETSVQPGNSDDFRVCSEIA